MEKTQCGEFEQEDTELLTRRMNQQCSSGDRKIGSERKGRSLTVSNENVQIVTAGGTTSINNSGTNVNAGRHTSIDNNGDRETQGARRQKRKRKNADTQDGDSKYERARLFLNTVAKQCRSKESKGKEEKHEGAQTMSEGMFRL